MISSASWYQMLSFPARDTHNGVLVAFQGVNTNAKEKLPFEIKRVLVMKNMKEEDVRGGHTHHKTNQILFAISGACTVTLDNGAQKSEVRLEAFNEGVWLKPYVWHVMKEYDPGTVLLVLADSEYDEADYIRNYDAFLKCLDT